jgi:hypothetical protein
LSLLRSESAGDLGGSRSQKNKDFETHQRGQRAAEREGNDKTDVTSKCLLDTAVKLLLAVFLIALQACKLSQFFLDFSSGKGANENPTSGLDYCECLSSVRGHGSSASLLFVPFQLLFDSSQTCRETLTEAAPAVPALLVQQQTPEASGRHTEKHKHRQH